MDKIQKHDYMQTVEAFLEQNQIYELFEDLLKQLIVARPEDPLAFLIQKIKQSSARRIFLVGAAGCERRSHLEQLGASFDWKTISTGKLLQEAAQSNDAQGQRIKEQMM
jgi:adenylate kinase